MLVLNAPAKINLFLQTTGKRDDGYHLIESIMQTVDLCDEISMELTNGEKVELSCNDSSIPVDEKNIVIKIANKLMEYKGIKRGVKIHIEKNIPSCAGMGGGSADGATALVGLNKLLSLNLSKEELNSIAVSVGADIPFLVDGGTAITKGIGEKITKIKDLENCYFVIVKPDISIDTKTAYKEIDEKGEMKKADINSIITAINKNSINEIGKFLYNEFELVAPSEIKVIKEELRKNGALNSLMTGSGSAVFGIFDDYYTAILAKENLEEKYDKVFLTKPIKGN